ncbi:VOC family protein [Ancylobacter sp. Lp-2]|uniref:VOC family protein n=1 Tax=Ancylobacter sp. Lp-2 TaxID=2881339 RepID=UPI001E5B3440|nr:VOC family protein [Ancylobacter sp. Lp-2]MCB4771256.1 VOC family protein [Ancylobacter sp. Lp-2]
MIVGIDHIEIIVRDVKEYVEFYQKLGFKLLNWTDHHGGSAELQLPGDNQPIFEIHQLLTEENPGINHISFKVRDIDDTHADLVNKGISFYRDVHPSPSTGRKNALLRDPDGWRLQLSDEKRVEHTQHETI